MKTLFRILNFALSIIFGSAVILVYYLVFSPLWMIWCVTGGQSFDEWMEDWYEKTVHLFTFEWL